MFGRFWGVLYKPVEPESDSRFFRRFFFFFFLMLTLFLFLIHALELQKVFSKRFLQEPLFSFQICQIKYRQVLILVY